MWFLKLNQNHLLKRLDCLEMLDLKENRVIKDSRVLQDLLVSVENQVLLVLLVARVTQAYRDLKDTLDHRDPFWPCQHLEVQTQGHWVSDI